MKSHRRKSSPGEEGRRFALSAFALAVLWWWGSLWVTKPVAATAPPNSSSTSSADQTASAAHAVRFFETEVFPLLQKRCFPCHSAGKKIRGRLRLDHRAGVLKGGETGPAVNLKQPEKSLLLQAIRYENYEMPPTGKLPAAEIAVLTKWVRMGVPWSPKIKVSPPATHRKQHEPPVNAETKRFWSFQPVKRPPVPPVKRKEWVRTPVDAFLLAKLEQRGLLPSPPAAKTELLRRAYYDLTGLPPSPEDVRAFLADDSPNAFEKVIDRLLQSPHYGEKWGRHWLDLVRYAETNSYERDGAKPFVWRYRDYVIRSFNADKPYTQFIREQLAGDELDRVTPETIIATGYYRLGIWQDEPVDPLKALYDDLDDILLTTSQVFLGLTMNCGRCHNHKIDPIPQRDYYRFLAFFSGLNRYGIRSAESVRRYSLRPIATEEQRRRFAAAVRRHQQEVGETNRRLAAVEKTIRRVLTNVEKEDFRYDKNRVALARKHVPQDLSRKVLEEYLALRKRRESLRRFAPPAMDMALCVTEIGPKPRPFHILIRGNPHVKGPPVEPGFPEVLSPPEPVIRPPRPGQQTCNRRRALAEWIASENNPLTARVMINRIWQYHFGRGLVRTPNNFGFGGERPTHPELLDWLAAEFVQGGWRLKRMHKLIMLSNAYRMSSRRNARAVAIDPANDLFWRFNMRRLTAEEIRDSILAVNGALNRKKMYGPSVYTIMPAAVLAGQSRPGSGWGKSPPEERNRRSIYIHVKRSLLHPLLFAFDMADPDSTCPVRFSTTQPTQALGMLNSDFIHREAAVFADFLQKQSPHQPRKQVETALWRLLQRPPTEKEIQRGVQLIASLRREEKLDEQSALKMFCLVGLNLNEFLFLD